MLKSMGKNKKYIWWMITIGLFGIAGVLLARVIMYIIKVSDRYPKLCRWIRWIFFTLFIIAGIYGSLFEGKWDMGFVMICAAAVIAVSSMSHYNRR